MPFRVLSLIALAFVIGLIGCRDALVDEPLLPENPTSPPTDSTSERSIYLKGPDELRIGDSQNYRAEPLPDATRYRWALVGGTGSVSGVPTDPLARLYDITGAREGTVEIFVSAYDEADEVIGVGSKTVAVVH